MGIVNLELVGWAPGANGVTHVSVNLGAARGAGAQPAPVVSAPSVTLALNHVVSPVHSTSAIPNRCSGGSKVGGPVYPLSEIGTAYPYMYTGTGDYAWMTVSATQSQNWSLGVGYSYNNQNWGVSGTSGISSTVGFDWGTNPTSWKQNPHVFEATQVYQKWYISCLAEYEEVPEGLAGGFASPQVGWTGFSYNCQNVPPGHWYRETQGGNTFSLGGGVMISGVIGINLSLNTAYDSARYLNYQLNYAGSTPLCGNNSDPAHASQVSEY